MRCSGTRGGTLLIRNPEIRARGWHREGAPSASVAPWVRKGWIGGDRFATAAPRGRPRKCSRNGTLGLGAGVSLASGVLSRPSPRRSFAHPLQTPPCPKAALNLGRTEEGASDPPFHYGVCCPLRRLLHDLWFWALSREGRREKEREERGTICVWCSCLFQGVASI